MSEGLAGFGVSLCLVTGSALAGPVSGLAAALAVAFARGSERGALLIDCVEPDRRRQPTLLASPSARSLESRLRDGGFATAARGHICLSAIEAGEPERILGVLDAVGRDARVVCHVDAGVAGAWLDQATLPVDALLFAASLPRERALAALVYLSLRDRGVVSRVYGGALGPLGGRRALAGMPPGGRSEARIGRFARALTVDQPGSLSTASLPVAGAAGDRESP